MKVTRFELKDPASGYNRSLLDTLRTHYYLLRYPKISIGTNTVIKKGVLFKLTDNAQFKMGDHCTIKEQGIFLLTKPNPFLEMGNYSGIGERCWISIKDHLKIGNYVRIGPDVCITDNSHQFAKDDLIMNQRANIQKVIIDDDAWMGRGVTVLGGVHVGQGAVLAAGSVATKNIPPYEIWAGNPARFVKMRE
ncbi:MAG: acyltransferase [Magnetococcales bacterium]|nr:acyltransferase [Magnetococcales bacterium]